MEGVFMKKMILFLIMLITLVSCATTGSIKNEKPEIKNVDGIYMFKNKTENSSVFFTGKSVYVKYKIPVTLFESVYYPEYIKLLVTGTTDSGNAERILYTSYATNSGEYEFSIKNPLGNFKNITITALNGTILDLSVTNKNGNLYLYIKDWDFKLSDKVSELIKSSTEKVAQEKEEKRQTELKKYNTFCTEVCNRGEKLFVEKVMPMQDKNIPIFINSYDIYKDSADGIEVSITFENIYNKTIKYVDFEVTPYNRVNDIAYSTIDGVSTKVIQAVDFIAPNKSYKAEWKPIWYNPTIAYIKINSVKVTFTDNTTLMVANKNIEKIFTKRELVKEVYRNGKQYIVLKYNVADNEFYAEYNLNQSMFMSSIFNYKIYFDTDEYYIDDKLVNSYHQQASGDYTTGLLKLSLDSKYLYYQLITSAKSGEIRTESRGVTPGSELSIETIYKFSEDDLKFIKDCVCMCYYRNLSK